MALTTAGLTNDGATAHYRFQYDTTLAPPGGLEPARTNAVIAACEGDFNLMREWFGNINLDVSFPISVNIVPPGQPGACPNPGGCWGRSNGNLTVIVSDRNLNTISANSVRYLMVMELVESFMKVQGLGWFGAGTEGSQGEGLSRFLGTQLLLTLGLGNPPAGYLNSNIWLSSERGDFVNNPASTDDGPDKVTGCTTLFIWYLFSQLGFSTTGIVAAGASPLSAVYKKLLGTQIDPFPLFKKLVDNILPGTSTITSGNQDNPFPATFDGILLQIRGSGPVWVIYVNGRFQVPDTATLSRIFPGALIFPYGDFLFAISTIPDDGTLLREESSSQVWIISNRTRALAPPSTPGTVHLLWDGALAQIPLPNGTLSGVVTDTNRVSLTDATILITSPSIIPSTGSNTEQLSTDSQGRYNSSVLPPGVYGVSASQDGFVPATASVTVLVGVPTTNQNFALIRAIPFTITGQVINGAGAPVVATVRLTENSAVPGIITTKTDAVGHYTITMDPGPFNGTYTIDVTAVGFASASRTITIPNGANITLNFTLFMQGILTGHLNDQLGPALGGATVTVGPFETFSDVAGAYKIMVDPGPYGVKASAPGYTSVNVSITIPSGLTVTQDFVLTRTLPGSISGTVTDDNGTPLLGARVAALNTNLTTTDSKGKYMLTNLQPGPTPVVASRGIRFIPDKATVVVISGETVTQDFALVLKGGTT